MSKEMKYDIQILIEDDKIFDIEGDDCDKYESEKTIEFEQSKIGRVILSQGYKFVHRDFDDNTLMLIYRR